MLGRHIATSMRRLAGPATGLAARTAAVTTARAISTPAVRSFSASSADPADVSLVFSPEALELYNTAKKFADAEMAPHAAEWDEKHYFPEETLRKAAELGFAGLNVSADAGGSDLPREHSLPIVEALAGADTSTTAYLTIHNMCAW